MNTEEISREINAAFDSWKRQCAYAASILRDPQRVFGVYEIACMARDQELAEYRRLCNIHSRECAV